MGVMWGRFLAHLVAALSAVGVFLVVDVFGAFLMLVIVGLFLDDWRVEGTVVTLAFAAALAASVLTYRAVARKMSLRFCRVGTAHLG